MIHRIDTDINSMYPFMMTGTLTLKIVKGYDSHQKQKHSIKVTGSNYAQIEEMKQWVSDTFGAKTIGWWNPRWAYAAYGVWHFKNEADAAFFMLRWL